MTRSAHELFSMQHISGDRWLARLDARIKLLVVLAAILAVLLLTHVWLPLATSACCAAILLASGACSGACLPRWPARSDWPWSCACCGRS